MTLKDAWFSLVQDAKGEVNEELPRALSAFELRARTLPKAVRQLVSVVMLFPPSKQIPVPAFLAIAAVCTDRPLDECAMLLQELASAFFVEVRGPSRRLNTGAALPCAWPCHVASPHAATQQPVGCIV